MTTEAMIITAPCWRPRRRVVGAHRGGDQQQGQRDRERHRLGARPALSWCAFAGSGRRRRGDDRARHRRAPRPVHHPAHRPARPVLPRHERRERGRPGGRARRPASREPRRIDDPVRRRCEQTASDFVDRLRAPSCSPAWRSTAGGRRRRARPHDRQRRRRPRSSCIPGRRLRHLGQRDRREPGRAVPARPRRPGRSHERTGVAGRAAAIGRGHHRAGARHARPHRVPLPGGRGRAADRRQERRRRRRPTTRRGSRRSRRAPARRRRRPSSPPRRRWPGRAWTASEASASTSTRAEARSSGVPTS